MMRQSLGLIETVGLTAAITAADAALKSANVRLAGYELAKGGGLATVKVCGDVGAVKAAVAAATASAAAVGRVVAVTVIARPAKGLDAMTASKDTVGAGMGAGMGVGAKADAGETPDPAPEKKAGPEEPAQESAKAQGPGQEVRTPGQDAAHPPPAEYTEHAEKTHGAAVPKPSPARKAGKKGKK